MRSTRINELIKLAMLAAVSMVVRPYVRSAVAGAILSLGLPVGSVIGGLYMLWPLLAVGLFPRRGNGLLFCTLQGVLALLLGMTGKTGALGLLSFLAPGLIIEGWMLLLPHTNLCRRLPVAIAVTSTANAAGAVVHGIIYFGLGNVALPAVALTALLFGSLGGVFAIPLARILAAHRLAASQA